MKTAILIIVLFLAIVLFSTAIYFYTKNPGDNILNNNDNNLKLTGKVTQDTTSPNNQDTSSDQVDLTESESSSTTSTSSSSGGGGGGGSSSGGGSSGSSPSLAPEPEEPEIILPEDAYTVECGYYYTEYGGFCNGTCAEGECVSENRSCYCRK